MSETIFDKIAAKQMEAYIIWEDDKYMAFLTPFPNTPGVSVVIPKTNQGDYLFELSDKQLVGLTVAAKKVAKLLEKALKVERVAMAVDGSGVAYVHIQLVPMHGVKRGQAPDWPKHEQFNDKFVGYLTTADGPKMDDHKLKSIQQRIVEANQ